jgi:hypothetical protein
VIVPVIHSGMCKLADEMQFIGQVLHRAEFQHTSQPWLSPFHNLPTPLSIYLWAMVGIGGLMVIVGLVGLIRNTEPASGR